MSDLLMNIEWNDETRKRLGDNLKQLRIKAGLAAATVCEEALGGKPGTHVAVSRLERAIVAAPRAEVLCQLAKFYCVPVAQLVGLTAPVDAVSEREQSFGARLARGLKRSGMSRQDLAGAIRNRGAIVVEADVQAWETNQRMPNPIQLTALQLALPCMRDCVPSKPADPVRTAWTLSPCL